MKNSPTVLEGLRAATRAAHQALEDRMNAVERLSDDFNRRELLMRYYRLHASADLAIAPWLSSMSDLHYSTRQRTSALIDDLRRLELSIPRHLPVITAASQAEALGMLYVLEGSSLGGRMIRRALTSKGCDLRGLSFLDPYGVETGERWRGFLSVLEREGVCARLGVIRGGIRGFDHARVCLIEAEALA